MVTYAYFSYDLLVLHIYFFIYLFGALQIVHDIVAVIMTFIVMIELRNTVVGLNERRGT